jgi:predicted nucleic-acid-binding protein
VKGLDTNVLVRYLTQDDPAQGKKASRYIEDVISAGESCLIDVVVLCELIWVLESAYGYSKPDISNTLEKILMTAQFEVEHKETAWAALSDYKLSKADFADCLIGRLNLHLGCDVTASFDTALRNVPLFKLL